MPEETTTTKAAKERTVKAGDRVHAVCCTGGPGAKRFERCHRDATVEKVHERGRFVDLVIAHEGGDPDRAITLRKSPRDDAGQQLDSWHFIESE